MGLGNPGDEYRNTRHNVGQRVVDLLARALHKRPTREGPTLVARGEWQDETLYLVKPLTFVNVTGPLVARVADRLALSPADLILAYDDIDLTLGTVRVRMKGSHGGHKGVRSIIEALGTDEIRRVKIGVGRPPHKEQVPDHVLARFTTDEAPLIDAACQEAADRILKLVAARGGEGRR